MPRRVLFGIGPALGLVALALAAGAEPKPVGTTLRFEVALAKGLKTEARDGRLLVALQRGKRGEPRRHIGDTGREAGPLLGRDVTAFAPGDFATLDQTAAIFPIAHLAELPAGDYVVQAVFATNRDLNLPGAPGNLFSDPVAVAVDPAKGGVVKLELTKQVPEEELPPDTELVKWVKLKSELLTKFHGRPMYLRAGVVLPPDFARDKPKRYPLRVHIGGYGTRFTAARFFLARQRDENEPPFVLLHLDGAGPFGDPYQVNSANNGPYGDAVTQELIPHVEEKFRCIGKPWARVLDGGSTGGWVSLALQVFYPDFFNGCWSHCPDPVDFRAYELINIYKHDNAYVNQHGFERPAMRNVEGETVYTVRHECKVDVVLGRGDRWELSGKDWCAWNATFGPRGADGLPKPLWDGKTGKIDRTVLEHWKRYDLRMVLEKNWATLGPKLKGKIHIYVGEGDDYFLNNAVHLLDDFLRKAKPAHGGRIVFVPRTGHSVEGISEKDKLKEMLEAVERGRREAEGR
jgi:hypothetical protein